VAFKLAKNTIKIKTKIKIKTTKSIGKMNTKRNKLFGGASK
jgi:hypothetical protein